MRLLIIEDAKRLRDSLSLGLRKAGYEVDATGDGAEGLWYAKSNDYDVVILDLMLPSLDGISLLKKLRDAGKSTAVLILTARDTTEDKVNGLRQGADDYLVKPFAFDELLARTEALIRRQHGTVDTLLSAAGISIDPRARRARANGRLLELTAREYATLEYLVRRKGNIISRSDIEARVYDENVELMSNVVDTIIYNLRRKLESAGTPAMIHTIRGMGYELRGDAE